nr:PTS glucose transporter subunit IIA [Bacillus subtilis]
MDTVKLNGEGFEAHVTSGQAVKQGELLLTFDLNYIKQHAASAIT